MTVGTFELKEVESADEFRKLFLQLETHYLGSDNQWEYLGYLDSDTVYKISRRSVDKVALKKMADEKSKIKHLPEGPPLEYKRSKEFLDWLSKTMPSKEMK